MNSNIINVILIKKCYQKRDSYERCDKYIVWYKKFTYAWEQRKLSDCAEFRRGSFPQPYGNKDWYDGKGAMPFVQVADVSSDMKLVNDTKQKISKLAQPMSVFAEKGSVLVTLQGSIGRVAITQYGAFVDRTVLIFDKYKDDIDKKFWAYIIKEKFEYEAKKAPGGTIKTITKEVLANFDLMLPCYAEQSILADYLIKLDHLITLHQRKCDETKQLKKFMLQKMFPKNGEKNPEIRFEGFTDDWEQRKLSEICERITRKNRNNESDLPLTIASQFGLIDQRDFFNKVVAAKDMSNYYLLKKGEFAYNKSYSNGFDYGSIKRLNAYKQGCLSTLYICFGITSDEVESDYLECFFDTLKWYGDLSMICAEGARNHGLLNVDTKGFFDEVTVDLPKSLEEQKRISVYMNALNRLITLHQRKCEKLKELKKFMLQNMFV